MKSLYKTGIIKLSITFFLIIISIVANAAMIKGRVLDGDTHQPIPNASVSIVGTNRIVVSDIDGNYIINNVKKGTYTISSKCMGYENSIQQKIVLNSEEAVTNFDFYLKPSMKQLNEVLIRRSKNKESDISARNDEKIAPNIMNIISAKAIEMIFMMFGAIFSSFLALISDSLFLDLLIKTSFSCFIEGLR